LCNAVCQAKPAQTGFGKDDGVELTFVEFAQSGVDVAANVCDLEIGPMMSHLSLATQAACAHARALRKY